jgi:hypothetical protein
MGIFAQWFVVGKIGIGRAGWIFSLVPTIQTNNLLLPVFVGDCATDALWG